MLQRVHKAWEMSQRKDKELRGSSNGPIGGYHRWLKAYEQDLDWLPSLSDKSLRDRCGSEPN